MCVHVYMCVTVCVCVLSTSNSGKHSEKWNELLLMDSFSSYHMFRKCSSNIEVLAVMVRIKALGICACIFISLSAEKLQGEAENYYTRPCHCSHHYSESYGFWFVLKNTLFDTTEEFLHFTDDLTCFLAFRKV